MSKSEEEIRIERISEILEATRERAGGLLDRVQGMENLDSADLDEIIDDFFPEENGGFSIKSLVSILGGYELIVNVPGQMPPMIPAKYKGIFDWHHKEFLPAFSKLQKLLLNKFDPLIKAADKAGLSAFIGKQSMRETLLDIFEWEKKEKALPPIVTERDIGKIPEHIFERLTEIHRSFVFGNWIAAVALSRCLLEYAIVEQRDTLDIEMYAGKKKRVRWLSDLIEEVGEIHPELLPHMNQIKNAGDQVMHPPEENAERKLPEEDDAKECYVNIRVIIGDLYGK
ncbi:MAG: hypothetical protein MPK10_01475 [Gammaproteobacteria bacterium]|nr:hypothetical protein [Gammaproteobacteria bacterium]MDA7961469.1 hypothetical protein [Gammaproteobacteria bacterium]MDA7971241.1 hypothetical protein [Gammaproteobacteria bacterium]CAJ2376600.1 MAG: hypothetical protein IBGAMO2_390003 [Arenicellales bacterium IbO2]